MNKALIISIVFAALFLYHGVVYTAAWFQCGDNGLCADGKKPVK